MSKTSKKHMQLSSPELKQILLEELDKKCPDRDTALGILNILENRDKVPAKAPASKARKCSWLRVAATAAAIILVIIFAAPPGFGAENIVELVGRWTADIFALFRPDNSKALETEYVFQTNHPGLQQLYDTVVANGITEPVVPMWIPEEYELDSLEVEKSPFGMRITARLVRDAHFILLRVTSPADAEKNKFVKDNGDAFLQEKYGFTHYIFQNNNIWTSVWYVKGAECALSSNCEENVFETILNTIYLGVSDE